MSAGSVESEVYNSAANWQMCVFFSSNADWVWKWTKQIDGLLPGWVCVEQMPQKATQVTK